MFKSHEIISALQKAGFVPIRQKGSHVRLRHDDGRLVTVPSHSGKDIGRGLLRKILRDAEMNSDDLLKLLD
ncbi:type II toxin-antitoxin system HicA family toxin [Desulfonema magnum]|nr:type II toxin-antitoxin system HicA family toxin [Desulfonema magnum]